MADNVGEHTVIKFPTGRSCKTSVNQGAHVPVKSIGTQAPNETILTEKYTLLMLQKTTTVVDNWIINSREGDATVLTLKDEQGVVVERIFPGSIAECIFANLLGSLVTYTTKIKKSGKQGGDGLPNTAGMVWLVEEEHTIKVQSGAHQGVSFIGERCGLSSKPL